MRSFPELNFVKAMVRFTMNIGPGIHLYIETRRLAARDNCYFFDHTN